jgi:hypothetical protein
VAAFVVAKSFAVGLRSQSDIVSLVAEAAAVKGVNPSDGGEKKT